MKTLITPPIDNHTIVEYGISGPVWLDSSGIIMTVNEGEKEHTLQHAQSQIWAFNKIAKGIVMPLIVDFTQVKAMSREAREFYSSEENSKTIKALAIVTSSKVGRIVGNFFIGVNKVIVPTKIFNDVDQAMTWLKPFIN